MSTSKHFSIGIVGFFLAALLPVGVFAQSSQSRSATDTVTIASLADAQRKAILAKEREMRSKSSPVEDLAAQKRAPAPKPATQKQNLLYGIYTDKRGDLIAEVVQNGRIKLIREGQSIAGGVVSFAGSNSLSINTPAKNPCPKKQSCAPVSTLVSIGQKF
jgi:hypothetical protein